MSKRLPRVTAKELARFLTRRGFVLFDTKGSHYHYWHPITRQKVTIPMHAGKIVGPGLLKSILKQVALEWDE
ncbi:MAG: type II toxin-antitoxin system HicA family toxin [Deltaproteobacteria bacterium]|nr:type II toxin-antitoxin system HicA family toxin [Deltaproteobacteria bacterium]